MSAPVLDTPVRLMPGSDWLVIERPPDSLPAAVHRHLPVDGWMTYVFVGDAGVLYVGSTMRPRERMKEHAKEWNRCWRETTCVLARLVPTELAARLLEESLHADLAPREGRVTGRDRSRRRQLLAEAMPWPVQGGAR